MANASKADLTPHPLVPKVTVGLIALGVPLGESALPLIEAQELAKLEGGDTSLSAEEKSERATEAAKASLKKLKQAPDAGLNQRGARPESLRGGGGGDADLDALAAQALAGASDVPGIVTFAGYVGGLFERQGTHWCVFYLDTRLLTWLLVQTDGIVYRDPIEDDDAPCRQRDVLWVKGDTAVGRGDGSQSVQAQFLTGEFSRAADFDVPPSGGTLAAATGVFCEARSVGCCRRTNPLTRP